MTESPGGATVRSVRVKLDLDVANYVANSKLVGRETEGMADRIDRSFSRVNHNLGETENDLGKVSGAQQRTSRSTKQYTLEMAVAEEKSSRLRKSLKEQARGLVDVEQGLNRTERSMGRNSKALDTFSGRTGLLLRSLTLLGPALVPLGAGSVPLLSALASGGGAAAAGIGATVLALKGVGDGLKALDAYQLEKTPENLAKVREEFAKLGPDGEHFVRFLDSIEPELKDLQNTARAGVLPGFEDSITSLLGLLPMLRTLVGDVSKTVGDLAADAGKSLAGDDFEAFFDYLRTDAAPTLEAVGQTLGNFVQAFANLLVGLAPATRDATDGIVDWSQSLVDASKNLDTNDGFQRFVATIREEGPEAAQFIGELVTAITSIVEAVAPVGSATLPILTNLLDIIGKISGTPLGPVFFAAVSALTAYNTMAKLVTKTSEKLAATSDRLTSSTGRSANSLVRVGKTAAGIAAVATVVGALADNIGRIKSEDLERNLSALATGDVTNQIDDIIGNIEELTAGRNKVDLGEIVTLGGLAGDTTLDKYADNVNQVDQSLAQLVESGNVEEASVLFAKIADLAAEQGVKYSQVVDQFDAYGLALSNAAAAGGPLLDWLGNLIPTAGDAADATDDYGSAADRAAAASKAEAHNLNLATQAMRDKRDEALAAYDAETAWGQAVQDAADAVKAGHKGLDRFTEAGRKNRDVLSGLASSWNEQDNAVKNNVDRFKAARKTFIDTATAMGMPIGQAKELAKRLLEIPRSTVAKVTVDKVKEAMGDVNSLRAAIAALRDRTVHINVVTGHEDMGAGDFDTHADGGTIGGQRRPYRDKVLAYLAPGEEVISNRHGQADRARPILKRINANRFADGGTVATHTSTPYADRTRRDDVAGAAAGTTRGLKALEAQLKRTEKSLDQETKKRDRLQDRYDSIQSSTASSLTSDLFTSTGNAWDAGGGMSDPISVLQSDIANERQFDRLRRRLSKRGLDDGALEAAAAGGVAGLQQISGYSDQQLAQYEALYNQRAHLAAVAGGGLAQDLVGSKLDASNERLDDLVAQVKELRKDVKNEHGHDRTHATRQTAAFAGSINGAADQAWRDSQ